MYNYTLTYWDSGEYQFKQLGAPTWNEGLELAELWLKEHHPGAIERNEYTLEKTEDVTTPEEQISSYLEALNAEEDKGKE